MTTFLLVHGGMAAGATSGWREEDIEARRRPAPVAHPGEQFCTYAVGQRAHPPGPLKVTPRRNPSGRMEGYHA